MNESQVCFISASSRQALEARLMRIHLICKAVLKIDVRSGRRETKERAASFTQSVQGLLLRVCEGHKDIITKREQSSHQQSLPGTKLQIARKLDG